MNAKGWVAPPLTLVWVDGKGQVAPQLFLVSQERVGNPTVTYPPPFVQATALSKLQ